MLMSAFGILFVVDSHCGGVMNPLSEVFPYDSFFMPMFVFISGYFFKESDVGSLRDTGRFLLRKLRRIFLPYLGWMFLYGVFIFIFVKKLSWLTWSDRVFSDIPLNILTTGDGFNVNGAAWFVPLLFFVTVVYAVIRRIVVALCPAVWNDIAAFSVFAVLGGACAWFSASGASEDQRLLLLLKIGFFLQFYAFGQLFRRYLEPLFDRISAGWVCVGCIAVNLTLLLAKQPIQFPRCATMMGFSLPGAAILPLITSLTGIFFWLKICKLLSPALGGSRIWNTVSDNTFFIMEHHLLVKCAVYVLYYLLFRLGLLTLEGFDVAALRATPWFTYRPNAAVCALTFFLTTGLTLAACLIWNSLKTHGIHMLRRGMSRKKDAPGQTEE